MCVLHVCSVSAFGVCGRKHCARRVDKKAGKLASSAMVGKDNMADVYKALKEKTFLIQAYTHTHTVSNNIGNGLHSAVKRNQF